MDTTIALKWANALESGKYRRTNGFFATKDTQDRICYCALGVLGNIVGIPDNVMLWRKNFGRDFAETADINLWSLNQITIMNDGHPDEDLPGDSWASIARYIRDNYKEM